MTGTGLLRFLAIIVTAIALIPAGAHLFALPNKIGLPQDQYFVVQQIYAGWAWLGVVLFAEIILDFALVIATRGGTAMIGPLIALVAALAALAIFFAWTYPANLATENWTAIPDNWQVLRRQWEYSHAAAAIVTFIGLCALVWSAVRHA
jgi:hypothetical protein